ncbi:MAG: DUF3750 domain-containing protein [Cyclobacteriaceae bacterium]
MPDKPSTLVKSKKTLSLKLLTGGILFIGLSFFSGVIKTSYIDRESHQNYQLAPYPSAYNDAIIQIYAARTRGTKRAFAVHSWIAYKKEGASDYIVSQVIGWRLRSYGTTLFSQPGIPDDDWAGNPPTLLLDLRGPKAEELIPQIESAIDEYPYASRYTVWPGPNSNTFISWVGRQVPELGVDLPTMAIGKDWRPINESIGISPSGTGVQASLFGLLGLSAGIEEGLELNILSLNVELDLFDLAIEVPGYGRIGKAQVSK